MLTVLTRYATRGVLASGVAVSFGGCALAADDGVGGIRGGRAVVEASSPVRLQGSAADLTREVRLFEDDTLGGWTLADGRPIRKGWRVSRGVLHLDPRQGRAGHIVTEREFGDFDLKFEWKIAEGGNSGLKYRVRRYAHKMLGCEYQLLDDAARGGLMRRHSTGALYDLYEPDDQKTLRPPGQYNSSRIVVTDNRAEHWLNGKKILAVDIGGDEWVRRVKESKFSELTGFGQNRYGRLMLTDHRSEVWYRSFRMNLLPMNDLSHEGDRSDASASR